ncbi:hypothetical protein JDW15_00620 [Aerococcaceae bacterium zg-ZJ1578]|uniref:hypothetical protein n=1 Tax=Aerococcaceae TaxID=186827 RepID=UPI0013BD9AFA|nr:MULTISPECIES: hypothetical protein [unclassified Facklamia]MBK0347135.1 hypothetical protein [Aerococcaceae bacterium zg-1578]MBS4462164.1 hypothetical protein [Aerococcaceae bacterium zg-B36]QQD65435.1 hypothetical protein JDW14_09205 [Aerococcaceae bacterium zg-252]NEW64622.1 hypothetical protein [Facklamia sp. 252]NEW67947.1 hypothetical protein [Facklamia sp. 253]
MRNMSDKEWLLRRRLNRIFHLMVIILGTIYFLYTWANPTAMRYFFIVGGPIAIIVSICELFLNVRDWLTKKKEKI